MQAGSFPLLPCPSLVSAGLRCAGTCAAVNTAGPFRVRGSPRPQSLPTCPYSRGTARGHVLRPYNTSKRLGTCWAQPHPYPPTALGSCLACSPPPSTLRRCATVAAQCATPPLRGPLQQCGPRTVAGHCWFQTGCTSASTVPAVDQHPSTACLPLPQIPLYYVSGHHTFAGATCQQAITIVFGVGEVNKRRTDA